MTNFTFAQFDPRPVGREANEAVFAAGPVFGVEVTIPALAARCVDNLDHHRPGDTAETPSAIEQAMACPLPPTGAVLATVRPDADSIGAMAVLASRVDGLPIDADLVRAIGRFDRLGPSAMLDYRAAIIGRVAADHKRSLAERVAWIQAALLDEVPDEEWAQLLRERQDELKAAQAASETCLAAGGRIAVVESGHRFATNLGYAMAKVVVAMNPAMPVDLRDPVKGTYRKFTVCRYDSHVPADLESALAELQSIETGWGGRGDIFGSPQGVSSTLTLDEVVAVISRHLK